MPTLDPNAQTQPPGTRVPPSPPRPSPEDAARDGGTGEATGAARGIVLRGAPTNTMRLFPVAESRPPNAPGFTPAQNLACDEALLEACDAGAGGEVLRLWESPSYFVVVGYGQSISREVNPAACRERGIPILRRSSGGGTVLQGPGCLNYSLVLRTGDHEACRTIGSTNRFIMQRHRAVMARLVAAGHPAPALAGTFANAAAAAGKAVETIDSPLEIQGFTDLTWRGRKFSGNAQRRRQHALLFHGTFLLDFDLGLVDALLPPPSRAPDYRQNRCHSAFLTNLPVSAKAVKTALIHAWSAAGGLAEVPRSLWND